jgi:hypothetical protein
VPQCRGKMIPFSWRCRLLLALPLRPGAVSQAGGAERSEKLQVRGLYALGVCAGGRRGRGVIERH